MRLTTSRLNELEQHVISYMHAHQIFKALKDDVQAVVYQAVADTDPAANGMAVIIHSLPGIVKDQLPKVGSSRVHLDSSDYKRLRGWIAAALGEDVSQDLPVGSPFEYHEQQVDFPEGKVFYSKTTDRLRPPKEGDKITLLAWTRVSMAKGRVAAAQKTINETAAQVRQLGVELLNLDALLQAVPGIKAALPLSWTEPPETPPVQAMLDPDTSAQLRKIILGDLA